MCLMCFPVTGFQRRRGAGSRAGHVLRLVADSLARASYQDNMSHRRHLGKQKKCVDLIDYARSNPVA